VSWDYRIEPSALRDLRDLGPNAIAEVRRYLDERIRGASDPAAFGKPLRGDKHGYWRYRVRDWRLLCKLENSLLIVVVVAVGHRSSVYDA
jgi:mRNA interferase RelE/StbE